MPFGGGYPLVDVKKDIHVRVDVKAKTASVGKNMLSWDALKQKYPDVYALVNQLL